MTLMRLSCLQKSEFALSFSPCVFSLSRLLFCFWILGSFLQFWHIPHDLAEERALVVVTKEGLEPQSWRPQESSLWLGTIHTPSLTTFLSTYPLCLYIFSSLITKAFNLKLKMLKDVCKGKKMLEDQSISDTLILPWICKWDQGVGRLLSRMLCCFVIP